MEGDPGALVSSVRRGGRPGLRASNKTSHPGRVDISEPEDEGENGQRTVKKPRRASEQVAAEKLAKAEEAQKDAAEKLQSKKKVAEIEDSLAEAAEMRKKTAACPPPGPIVAKASRPVAKLVADAEESVASIERQAMASMPPHPGLCRSVSSHSGKFFLHPLQASLLELTHVPGGKSVPEVPEELAIDEFDDADREDDEDYDPAIEKGKASARYVGSLSSKALQALVMWFC